MKAPTFSVVIPLYNKGGYILRSVQSVLGQSFGDFEIVVVDDGSTDDGAQQVESLSDPRVRLVRQPNGGVSAARNRGISEARGSYVAFLDADDEWREAKLEMHAAFFARHPECPWAISGFTRRYRNREADAVFCETTLFPDVLAAIVAGLVVWTGGVVVRRDCFSADCLFPVGISRSEDREVWLKLACRYPGAGYLGAPLAVYHVETPGSLTGTASLESDFSFFGLASRLERFSALLPLKRRELLINYLNAFNRRACLSFTVSNRSFLAGADREALRRCLTRSQYACLRLISPCPAVVRRGLARLICRTGFF